MNTQVPLEGSSTDQHEVFLSYGLDIATEQVHQVNTDFSFEAPTRRWRATFHGKSHMGAFSYAAEGNLYNTVVGRYCSLAREINVGQLNHPTSWLSTNPFQYQKSFRINSGECFPFKDEYDTCVVTDENTRCARETLVAHTEIGHDVWIGFRAIITAGVKIGHGAIVGTGAVVTSDVPPYAIVGGVPAKIIRYRFSEEVIEKLLTIKWWDFAPWQLSHVRFSDIENAIEDIEFMRASRIEHYAPEHWVICSDYMEARVTVPAQSSYLCDEVPFRVVKSASQTTVDEQQSLDDNTGMSVTPAAKNPTINDKYILDSRYEASAPNYSDRFQSPPVHSYIIENGLLLGQRFFCCSLDKPSVSNARMYLANENILLDRTINTEVVELPKEFVYIVGANIGCMGFYHWIYQCLPAIIHARGILEEKNIRCKIVVPPLNSWRRRSLEICGLTENDWVVLKHEQSIVGARLFYSTLLSGHFTYTPSDLVFETMEEYKKVCLSSSSGRVYSDKIYVTRKDTHKRGLINEDDLSLALLERGFEIVTLTDISLEEQVAVFFHAKIIVSPHGSVLVNLMFCNANAHVIELMPEHFVNPCFFRIAQYRNMSYELILSETVSMISRHDCESKVDVDLVLNALDTHVDKLAA